VPQQADLERRFSIVVSLPAELNGEDYLVREVDLLAGLEDHEQRIRSANRTESPDERVVPALALA
jgi:hypothetical protein